MLLPRALTDLPSSSQAIKAFLADIGDLRVPVLPKFYFKEMLVNGLMRQLLAPTDDSMLPASLSSLLAKAPKEHFSELTTTVCLTMYFDTIFSALDEYSNMQLVYNIYLNKSEMGTSSRILKLRTRPDTSLVANSCLLLGEG